MNYLTSNDSAALHILSPCPHHNIPLISFLSELNEHLVNEYVILDTEENFKYYNNLEFDAKELFTRNSGLLPWLRNNYMYYDSIVIHGFFNQVLWELLEENIDIRHKSIWVVYGGDLCEHKRISLEPSTKIEIQRIRSIIPDMKKILTFTKDEDNVLAELYGNNCNIGKYMYYQSYEGDPTYKMHGELACFFDSGLKTAVVGNSGNITNRHIYILEELASLAFSGQVLLPLSYCLNDAYYDEIKTACEKLFPGRYFLLTELLANNDYFSLLKQCDFFFMGHLRQQAGQHWMFAFFHGKPIYGAPNTPFVNTLSEKGIFWGDIDNISFCEAYLKKFSSNHRMYEKYYGLAVVKNLWLEALNIEQ